MDKVVCDMNQLEKTFHDLVIQAENNQKAQMEFSVAYDNSKYHGIEMPDEVVEVLDYGRAKMTYERFIEIMDEELKTGS